MKMILKIARTELRNLFYSPVAWFLTIVFMVMCAMYYSIPIYELARTQDMAIKNVPKFKDFGNSLTMGIFLGSGNIFDSVLKNLYLFIPLLTMGLISRETNNGTIKLLYSSPVTIRQIVLGKYLAIMIYNLLLLVIVGVFMITGIMNIKSPDVGLLLSAGLGFYLLVCVYTAIGMFFSSITSYQIVSALGTFMLIFVLGRIGALWQQHDFVRDLTYFLSIGGRTDKMLLGLISTKDVMYFVLIVFMFVSFTLFKLKGGRESLPWYRKALRYLGVFVIVLVIGYATSRPGYIGYLDTTAGKWNTIHERTQKILAQTGDDRVEVTFFTNLTGGGSARAFPASRNEYVWGFWERYVRFKPEIDFKYVMYYDLKDGDSSAFKFMPNKTLKQIAEQYAEFRDISFSRFLEPKQIRKMIDMAPEDYRAVMLLKYKGQSVYLRVFDDTKYWPDEDHVAAAFKQLVDGPGPKVGFVSGELERSIYKSGEREFKGHTINKASRPALINHGFRVDTFSLEQQPIPADLNTLVLADPKVNLTESAIAKLQQYIVNGGNMVVYGKTGKQHVVNPVLKPFGVQLMNGTLVEVTANEMPHMVLPYVTEAATNLAEEKSLLFQKEILQRGLDTLRVLHPGAAGIAVADSGFSIKHLLVTKSRNTWAKVGPLVTDSAAPVFVEQEGDFKRDSFSTAVSLTRKIGNKEQRIVVAGDADWMSNTRSGFHYLGRGAHSWLDYNRYPIYVPVAKPKDVLLTVGPATAKTQKLVYIWILPALVFTLGTVLLIRRKRQ